MKETCDFCKRQSEEVGEVDGKLMCVACYEAATERQCNQLRAATRALRGKRPATGRMVKAAAK